MSEMKQEPDFYVGYQPRAAPASRIWIQRTIVSLLFAAGVIAFLLVTEQSQFPEARFEFGEFKPIQGVFAEWPYPTLAQGDKRLLLVAPGKHGLDAALVKGKNGAAVTLRGARIGADQMLEVEPGSLEFGGPQNLDPSPASLGRVTLTGEIVDTKCHFGVMNPGSGKVHRDCAARCLSGGIPPGLLVRDGEGKTHTLLLTGIAAGDLLDKVAEPVTVSGELLRLGPSTLVLRATGPAGAKRRE